MTFGAGKFGRLGHASEDDVGVPRVVDRLLACGVKKLLQDEISPMQSVRKTLWQWATMER